MAAAIAKIEIFYGSDGKAYFHTKARNGRVIDRSQGYTRRTSAKKAATRDYPGVRIVVLEERPTPA